MDYRILITGAAGYIGGTLIKTLVTSQHGTVQPQKLVAMVRSDKQALDLTALGVDTVCADLSDTDTISQIIVNKKIDIVVHCASAIDASLAKPLLAGLGKRIQKTGSPAYFIHTSGASAFADRTGWPHGVVSDTDPVHSLIKQTRTPYVIREVDNEIIDFSLENKVTTFIVVPPLVYGRGTGISNQQSFQLPTYIRASISNKAVYKFVKDSEWQGVHVTDLSRFYEGLISRIINSEIPPSGCDGYFFASAHKISWWDTLNFLATRLYARGLVSTPEVNIWPDHDLISKSLGLSLEYAELGWNSNSIMICKKGDSIGWKPIWDYEMLLKDLDGEIERVLEAGPNAKMMALPTHIPSHELAGQPQIDNFPKRQ